MNLYPLPLFALLAVLVLSVFLVAPVTVTLDGYSHLYQGEALRWMLAGQPEAHRNFFYNSLLLPDWLCALCLAALSKVVPAELALRLLMVFTGFALICSLYFCIDATLYDRRQRAQVLVILLPFALNAFLTLGFFGFLISSSMCFVISGLLLRYGLAMPFRLQCLAACLLMVAYFFNPLPVMLSFLFPCAYFIARAIIDWRDGWFHFGPTLRRDALNLWPWLPPACALPWFYLRLAKSAEPNPYSLAFNVKTRTLALAKDALLSISPTSSGGTLFIALVGILLAAVLVSHRKLFIQNPLRFMTLTLLIVSTVFAYLVVPDQVGDGADIANRFLFYSAIFLVLLALSSGAFEGQPLTLSSLVAAVLVVVFAGEYVLVARRLAPALAEVQLAMESLPGHSRILILGYRMTPSCAGWPLLERSIPERHWALAGALKNELIVLNDYQINASHFPLKAMTTRYAGVINGEDLSSDQTRAAWLEILKSNPPVDFVVSWGTPSGVTNCMGSVGPPFEEQLKRGYDLVFSKQGVSRVELWRKYREVQSF